MQKTIVVALGGNAILRHKEQGTAEQQAAAVRATCEHIAGLLAAGYRVTVTHGNGPQVGNILLQNEEASAVVPAMPLDICGAQSQGMIGYWLQQNMGNVLRERGLGGHVVTVLTQVVVDPGDIAFQNPAKPIGPFYTPDKARRMMERKGWTMKEDANRGWRRVVPSPDPRAIWERDVIRTLVNSGVVVICTGGGGVPVYQNAEGKLVGVEAVIDKDLASQRLALELGAQILVILTDVDKVALHFGKPEQVDLDCITAAEGRAYLAEGYFKPGSMGPKVEAALRFVEQGGEKAIITSLEKAGGALHGSAGTAIVP